MTQDLEHLCWAGGRLDHIAEERGDRTFRELLIELLLRIRDKHGRLRSLTANRAQAEFSQRCGRRNIVLKARQLGITTWVAARFFLATITRPGTVSVQVAHDQSSAEEIFRIVHRFLANLP
ncbi:MAG: terminase, partial [Terriglobales bacterium]